MTSHHIIAGGGGFIGINLARRLLNDKSCLVTIVDNYSNAHVEQLKSLLDEHKDAGRVVSLNADISDYRQLDQALGDRYGKLHDTRVTLWHMAANSDIPSGIADSNIDLKDTFMTTFNLVNYCREKKIDRFIFASSSAIYGDHGDKLISESASPLMPISNYGAMKLASEAICLSAYHEFMSNLYIFRFPNVVGTPATHGVIYDFIGKLERNPNFLDVLGNGLQKKSYLHVSDLVEAMVYLSSQPLNNGDTPIFNLGPSADSITVKEIAQYVICEISPSAKITYGTTSYGWKGDIPKFSYDISKAKAYGWEPRFNSSEAIQLAIKEIAAQPRRRNS